MTTEELRIASNTVLDIDFSKVEERALQDETQFICEGDEDRLKLMEILKDNTITGRDRQHVKFLNFPHLYGTPSNNMVTYASGAAGGKSGLKLTYNILKKRRSEGRIKTFQIMYGSQYEYIPTKVKKGAGKGQYRLQKIRIKPKNVIDNLNW